MGAHQTAAMGMAYATPAPANASAVQAMSVITAPKFAHPAAAVVSAAGMEHVASPMAQRTMAICVPWHGNQMPQRYADAPLVGQVLIAKPHHSRLRHHRLHTHRSW